MTTSPKLSKPQSRNRYISLLIETTFRLSHKSQYSNVKVTQYLRSLLISVMNMFHMYVIREISYERVGGVTLWFLERAKTPIAITVLS